MMKIVRIICEHIRMKTYQYKLEKLMENFDGWN